MDTIYCIFYVTILTGVLGVPYDKPIDTPQRFEEIEKPPMIESGPASWYGIGNYHGDYTATGERFNPEAITCASRTIELDTWIRVTNVGNGKSVWCRVNDRGPYWGIKENGEGYIRMTDDEPGVWRNMLDLSLGTAKALSNDGIPRSMDVVVRQWRSNKRNWYHSKVKEYCKYDFKT